jgi:hypothetical protein
MAFDDTDVSDAQEAAAKNAARGVKSLTIGDRRIDYQDPVEQIKAARMMAEDENGGVYTTTFPAKGYF